MKKFLVCSVMALSCLAIRAQTGQFVFDRIFAQREAFPLERVYVHTDAEDYLQGDRIWLKAYLMDEVAHTPVDSTLYLYAELFDKDGKRARQAKLLRRQGAFYGYLDIPEDFPSGETYLRAYSRYMGTAPETAFVKRLTVGRGKVQDPVAPVPDQTLQVTRLPHGFRLTYPEGERSYLIVLRGGEICNVGAIGDGRIVTLPDGVLPDGPLEFLVVDRAGKVVTSREAVLDRGLDRFSLPVTLDKQEYKTGDLVTMRVDASSLREGELLDLSVAVTCLPLIARHHPASITDYVLGRTPGFGLADALQGNIRPNGGREVTGTLSGSVRTEFLGRAVKDARVGLISPDAGILDVQQSDAGGRFCFEGLDFPEGTHYLVKSTDQKGRDRYSLVLDEPEYPPFRKPENPYATALDESIPLVYADEDSPFDVLDLMAAGVSVTVNDGPPPTGFNRGADFAVSLRQIEERGYSTLEELLMEVPGVFFKDEVIEGIAKRRAYIRADVSINADVPAAIAIDGTILDGEYDLDVIRMPDVARVDIFKTGQTVIWGARGGGGVISVTTKTGDLDAELIRGQETVHQEVIPLGYQPYADFLAATAYRNRRTVYWNPLVLSETVSFWLRDVPGQYRIVLEGVTSEGRLVHEERTFEVSR